MTKAAEGDGAASDQAAIRSRLNAQIFRAIAKDRGLRVSDERLQAAVEMHAKFQHELDRLRATRLEFLPTYVEPATALRWIEKGGRFP